MCSQSMTYGTSATCCSCHVRGGVIVETVCFSYTNIPTLKVQAWARLRGWIWQSACRTALQNIVFSRGNKLYAYDFDADVGATDCNDPVVNGGDGEPSRSTGNCHGLTSSTAWTSSTSSTLRSMHKATAPFTCEAYVDNIVTYKGTRPPMLSMEFIGGDAVATVQLRMVIHHMVVVVGHLMSGRMATTRSSSC